MSGSKIRLACVMIIIDPSFIDNKPPTHDIPGLMLYTTLFGRQYAPWIDEVESYFSLVHEGVKVTTHSIHCTGLTSERLRFLHELWKLLLDRKRL